MAVTNPDNIWTPDSGDNYALTTDLAATADSLQTMATEKANYGVGTSAERTAALGRFPNGALWYDTTTSSEWRKISGAWVNQDTGWVTIATPSGWTAQRDIRVRRIGSTVLWQGRVTPDAAKSGTVTLLAAGATPAGSRPVSIYDAMRPLSSSQSASTAESAFKNGAVNADGSVTIWYGTSNSDPVNLAGLSGYTVD